MFGVSIALSTLQNNTNVTWSLGGSTSTPGVPTSTSISLSPTNLAGGGGVASAARGTNPFGGYHLKRVVAGWLSSVVVGCVLIVIGGNVGIRRWSSGYPFDLNVIIKHMHACDYHAVVSGLSRIRMWANHAKGPRPWHHNPGVIIIPKEEYEIVQLHTGTIDVQH
jgi:hypothetical protein